MLSVSPNAQPLLKLSVKVGWKEIAKLMLYATTMIFDPSMVRILHSNYSIFHVISSSVCVCVCVREKERLLA